MAIYDNKMFFIEDFIKKSLLIEIVLFYLTINKIED